MLPVWYPKISRVESDELLVEFEFILWLTANNRGRKEALPFTAFLIFTIADCHCCPSVHSFIYFFFYVCLNRIRLPFFVCPRLIISFFCSISNIILHIGICAVVCSVCVYLCMLQHNKLLSKCQHQPVTNDYTPTEPTEEFAGFFWLLEMK